MNVEAEEKVKPRTFTDGRIELATENNELSELLYPDPYADQRLTVADRRVTVDYLSR